MTEYDYSPGAYERYQQKLNSVGKWAERNANNYPNYADPFLPSASGSSDAPQARPATRYRSMSQSTVSPTRARSMSATRPDKQQSSIASSTTYIPTYQDSPHHSRSSSRSHTRPPPSRSRTYVVDDQKSYRSHASSRSYSYPTSGMSGVNSVSSQHYTAHAGQPVIVQSRNHSYVLIPTRKTQIEVQTPSPHSSRQSSRHSSRRSSPPPIYQTSAQPHSPYSHHSSHTSSQSSSKKPGLFKRILGYGSGENVAKVESVRQVRQRRQSTY
ncbi:hypothetical protein BD410DRAFT_785534 [Rickenella mellea]|uniref:Uncharacterized protein n=1 Tax=Rickenella mellea TaxID=50990 RepID=A0A4Y7QBJ5_9AGAM|nr:hypothetical protein BD410DRAFT_785534 [Rickenella mellea]